MFRTSDKGVTNPELTQGIPASFQFRYAFKRPILSVCEAFMNKYNWEGPQKLTTIEKVEQLDDDRIVMYRRHDAYNAPFTTWEQVIINRQNQSIEADIVGPNPNGSTYSVEKTVYRPNLASKAEESLMDTYVLDVQGMGTGKVEAFKNQVVMRQNALQFTEWAKEG